VSRRVLIPLLTISLIPNSFANGSMFYSSIFYPWLDRLKLFSTLCHLLLPFPIIVTTFPRKEPSCNGSAGGRSPPPLLFPLMCPPRCDRPSPLEKAGLLIFFFRRISDGLFFKA